MHLPAANEIIISYFITYSAADDLRPSDERYICIVFNSEIIVFRHDTTVDRPRQSEI